MCGSYSFSFFGSFQGRFHDAAELYKRCKVENKVSSPFDDAVEHSSKYVAPCTRPRDVFLHVPIVYMCITVIGGGDVH